MPFDREIIYNNEAWKNAIKKNHECYPGDFRKI